MWLVTAASQEADLEVLFGPGRFYEVLLSHPSAWEVQAALIKDLEGHSYSCWANQGYLCSIRDLAPKVG